MHYYCTYFDENYLTRGLTLYHSMMRHDREAQLWVLCLSARCHEILTQLGLPGIQPFTLEQLEQEDPALAATRASRTLVEYYFTCTPSLMLYVMRRVAGGDLVTYLDSDMYFFEDPVSVFAEIADRSIAIIPHGFAPHLLHLRDRGIYNVGWVSIRHDSEGLACAQWWRERCIEWCHDLVEPERYADQKYLNRWPEMFRNVAILRHKGVNTAPFNLANYTVRRKDDRIWIDEDPLVIFHFHGFRQLNSILYDPNLANYQTAATRVIRRQIYGTYIKALEATKLQLRPFFPPSLLYSRYPQQSARPRTLKLDPARRVVNEWRIFRRHIQEILGGKRIFYIAGRVL